MDIPLNIVTTATCLAALFVMTAIAAFYVGANYVAFVSLIALGACAVITCITIIVDVWMN